MLQRVRHFLRRRRLSGDIDDELRFHIEQRTQENIASGMSPDEARRAARLSLGNPLALQEETREVWSFPLLETLWQDIRYGLRQLRRNPGFAAIAIVTLALGIGASAAIFSVVDAVLLRPLPYPNPQRIVTVWETEAKGNRTRLADPNFLDFRAQNHTLSALAVFASGPDSVSGGSEPVRLKMAAVSRDFFKVLGVEPFLGRTFSPNERVVNGTPAMIVSYGYWREFLGGRRDLSHFRLTMDQTVFPVIGVMPRGFDFPRGVSVWVAYERYGWSKSRTSHNGNGIGRLRKDVTLDQARADLETIARRIHAEFPEKAGPYFLTGAAVIPLADEMVANVRSALLVLFGAVILLFLVACANVAGLLVARTAARRKELAVRAAVGAGRGRLVQQLLAESLTLSLGGGALGILLAAWTTNMLPAILPSNLPRQQSIALNFSVISITISATVIVAIGLGLFAAWRASHADPGDALSASSRGFSSGGQKPRSALMIGEIAATMMLLVGAGLLGRSFLRLVSVSPGFSKRNLLVMKFSLPQPAAAMTQPEIASQAELLESALTRIRAVPGVISAGVTGALPIADADGFPDGEFLILNGQPAPTNAEGWRRFVEMNKKQVGEADYAVASSGFFRSVGIPLIRGRLFDAQDGVDAANVALISQTLAREYWRNRDPIGQRIFFGNMDGILKPLTIVGVVGDVRAEGLDQPPTPIIYVDYRQRGLAAMTAPAIVLRTNLPASAIVPPARAIFHDLNPNTPVEFSTFAEALGVWLSEKRFLLLLSGIFAGAALLLAAVGIYGLVAQSMTRRTQEIGIRMALGARRGDVLRLAIGQGMTPAALGLGIGIAGALGLTRVLSSLLYGVTPSDPLTFLVAAAILTGVALLACWIPARRAMRVDPVTALKYE